MAVDTAMRLARAAASLSVWELVKGRAERISESRELVPADVARVDRGFWPKLRRNLGRVPFVDELLAAFYALKDPATPATAKAVLAAALAYFVVPTDLVPDIVLGAGFLDDATVLGFALNTVGRHIRPEHRLQADVALARRRAAADSPKPA